MQSPLSVRFFVKSGPNYVMGLEHDVGDINKGTDDQCSIRDQCRDPMGAPKTKEDNGCSNEIDNKYVLLSEKCAFVFINFNPLLCRPIYVFCHMFVGNANTQNNILYFNFESMVS